MTDTQRLRHRVLAIAARLATSGRRRLLHLSRHALWTLLLPSGLDRLDALAVPD